MGEIHDELVPEPHGLGALNPAAKPFGYQVGGVPPAFGSRDPQLTAGADHLQRLVDRRPGGLRILEGVRGVGKTSLMARLRAIAQSRGLVTAHVELTATNGDTTHDPVRRRLLRAAQELTAGGQLRTLSRRLTAIRLGPAGVKLADPTPEPANIRELVAELGLVGHEVDRPVFITVDEAHEVPVVAGHIVAGIHAAIQDSHPIGAYLAGLPGTQPAIASSYSYAERIVVDPLEFLDQPGVHNAIATPFAQHDIAVEVAVAGAVRGDGGIPLLCPGLGGRTVGPRRRRPPRDRGRCRPGPTNGATHRVSIP